MTERFSQQIVGILRGHGHVLQMIATEIERIFDGPKELAAARQSLLVATIRHCVKEHTRNCELLEIQLRRMEDEADDD